MNTLIVVAQHTFFLDGLKPEPSSLVVSFTIKDTNEPVLVGAKPDALIVAPTVVVIV